MEKMNRSSALRTARTAITGAQNAGRQDSYIAAEKMGIKMKREWLATMDNRTRHAHAVLDGQRVGVNEPFKVDGYEIMFPGALPGGYDELNYDAMSYENFIGYMEECIKTGREMPEVVP